jgi:hypothetical protein
MTLIERSLRCLVVGALVLAGAAMTGCVRASAKAVSVSPPLETPAPPPRVIETAEVTPPALVPLIEEPARQPLRPAPRPAARPPATAGRAEPAEGRAEPPTPAEAPRVAEEPPRPSPPPVLQTTPAGSEGDVDRAIRVVIARANADLNRVNYRVLNADARTQYDTAKRFVEQAQDALRQRNLVFARNLADKALALAAQLAGR